MCIKKIFEDIKLFYYFFRKHFSRVQFNYRPNINSLNDDTSCDCYTITHFDHCLNLQ